MNLPKQASIRVASALALAALALPLSAPSGTPARAQVQGVLSSVPFGCAPSTSNTISTGCFLAVTPPVAFNLIGEPQSFTFTCDALTAGLFGVGGTAAAPTVPPGCYDVHGSAIDITAGASAAIVSATCGNVVAAVGAGSFDCSDVASPICPVGTVPPPLPGPTTPCGAYPPATGSFPANTATMTLNPLAPHAYNVTFTATSRRLHLAPARRERRSYRASC